MRLLRMIAFASLFCGLCWGQATDDCKPSSLNIPGAKYPCVYPDGRATFRVVAPDAQKVQVRVGKAFEMEADGLMAKALQHEIDPAAKVGAADSNNRANGGAQKGR